MFNKNTKKVNKNKIYTSIMYIMFNITSKKVNKSILTELNQLFVFQGVVEELNVRNIFLYNF
jgi:hypothetical protein